MENNFLTVDDVAKTLKVTRQTVSKYIQKKELNAVKINKSYRVSYQEFEHFLSSNSMVAEPETIYLKSRNCFLDFEGKSNEIEILNYKPLGFLKPINDENQNLFNKMIFGDNYYVLKSLLPMPGAIVALSRLRVSIPLLLMSITP